LNRGWTAISVISAASSNRCTASRTWHRRRCYQQCWWFYKPRPRKLALSV
jgi:hypothetical protein